MKTPQATLEELLALATELEIDLAKPNLCAQIQASNKYKQMQGYYSTTQNFCLDHRHIFFSLAVFAGFMYTLVFLFMLVDKRYDQITKKYSLAKQTCNEYNGTATGTAGNACHDYSSRNRNADWQSFIDDCCINITNITITNTSLCEETVRDQIKEVCQVQDDAWGAHAGNMIFLFVGGPLLFCLTYLAAAFLKTKTGYTAIPDNKINDIQVNLDQTQTQRLVAIIQSIRDINIAGSSSHRDPVSVQLGKLISSVNAVTLTSGASNTISAETIKEIYWALETLAKLSSSVKKIVSSQYNAQDNILDQDPEAGAGMSAGDHMSYQNK